jgi:short-subunit dehydrogenase
MEVRDRNVLVTGASHGIGREIAAAFAGAGARPVLVGRDEAALAQAAGETGGVALAVDLADPAQVAGLWDRAERAVGPLHVLVNNAGAAYAGDLAEAEWADVEEVFQVNVLAPMRLCRDALIRMTVQAGGGHLVNMSSLAGAATLPGMAPYAASKAALSHFTAELRLELAGLPIGTTLVELGPIPTQMLSDSKKHPPTDAGFRRLYNLRLLVDVDPSTVAAAVVAAVRRGRSHVRLPRRGAPLAMLPGLPRLASELAYLGVPRRTHASPAQRGG